MGTPLAYLITWTLRGTWLHGDPRGSADGDHRTYGSPYLPHQPNRQRRVRQQLSSNPALLAAEERDAVARAVEDTCGHRGWQVRALTVRSNHAHVVVSAEAPAERVMADLKSWATRAVRDVTPDRCAGLWTRHGSTRYLWDRASVDGAIRYVNAHDQTGPRAYARGSDGERHA